MENLARLTTHIRTELSKVIIGQQEIVVKQFDGVNSSKTLFSGATILGDGTPALIVDASSLL